MTVRVGVDATSWDNRRGYGRFARNAVGALVELDQGSSYVLYVDEARSAAHPLPERADRRPVLVRGAAADGASRTPRDLLRL